MGACSGHRRLDKEVIQVDHPECPFCSATSVVSLFHRTCLSKNWELRRCSDCGFYFTYPTPTREDIESLYCGDYHAELRVPGATERIFGDKFKRYVSWIQEFVPSRGRSLDIGCTTGLLPKMLKDIGFEAEGIELNKKSAAWGSEHYGVPIRVGGFEEVRGTYDLITVTDVLEHTQHPLHTLLSLRDHLTSNGYVVASFPDINSIESRYYRLLSRLLRRGGLWRTCHIPYHIWEFTPATARAMFNRSGFLVRAFRRSYSRDEFGGMAKLLSVPARLVALAPETLGTQMEFMLALGSLPNASSN